LPCGGVTPAADKIKFVFRERSMKSVLILGMTTALSRQQHLGEIPSYQRAAGGPSLQHVSGDIGLQKQSLDG
jgi:hypothetical protein